METAGLEDKVHTVVAEMREILVWVLGCWEVRDKEGRAGCVAPLVVAGFEVVLVAAMVEQAGRGDSL